MRCSLRQDPGLPAFIAGLCLAASPLAAQGGLLQLPHSEPGFAQQRFETTNVLPQNSAHAIVQTADGHVWLGTLGGLCRYDGARMEVFGPSTTPELRSSRAQALHETRDGALWIAFTGGGLACYERGRFRDVAFPAGPAVDCLGEDGDGRLLAGTAAGLWRREADGFLAVCADALTRVHSICRDGQGSVLVCSESGVHRLAGGRAEPLCDGATWACVDMPGAGLWLGRDDGLFRLEGGRAVPWQPLGALRWGVRCLLCAADGALVAGTSSGLVRIAACALGDASLPQQTTSWMPAAPAHDVRTLCQDHEGGLWVGFTDHGVERLRPAEVTDHGIESGLPERGLNSVVGDGRGGLFIGALGGLLHGDARGFVRDERVHGLGDVFGLARDESGTLWLGTTVGLARLCGDNLRLFGPDELPSVPVLAILCGPDGEVWAGGDQGLFVRGRGGAFAVPRGAEALRGEPVRTIVRAPDGALWIGGAALLARYEPSTAALRVWRTGVELPAGEVRAVLPGAGERAWIGSYGGGLVRVDGGRCVRVDAARGLFDSSLCAVLAVDGSLFAASNRGLFVVRRSNLEAVADGREQQLACRPLFGTGRHVLEVNGGFEPCAVSSGNRLWFCGIQALLEVDPCALAEPAPVPACAIESAVVGDERLAAADVLTVPPGVRTASFRLGACEFDFGAETRFRWRLGGQDAPWSAPTFAREALFANLQPGEYEFEAEAVDLLGRGSLRPARLVLSVLPSWWERPLMPFAAAVALLFAAWTFSRFAASRGARRAAELQQLVDRQTQALRTGHEQLERRVAERTRDLETAMQRQQEELLARHRLERQLQQLQRMESLGQLAGGVAHDFNNLLTVVLGAAELIVGRDPPPPVRELCDSIRLAGERGRSLTQHLLAVASRQVVEAEPLDLDRIVADLAPVLRSLVGEHVEVAVARAARPAFVRAAVPQIEQVLLNVVANARDAMPRGGRVEIAVGSGEDAVELVVRDNGAGMAPEVVEHVFEPFFSTKSGQNRGLGMSTVYGIVKQMGGNVRVDSEPGRGTTVTFRWLASGRTAAASAAAAAAPPRPGQERLAGTALLVEDQDDVRLVLRMLLERLGCSVCETASGDAAVARLRDDPGSVDMVLSDVVMPGLHGRALVAALHAVRPDLPIVFLSGWLDGKQTCQELLDLGLEVLTKPPTPADLLHALRRACARQAAARGDGEADGR
jgi:signal transduction histidine kinase/ligand-binding sensor domain-containing protein/CheY-like chemotaxis protein